MLHQQSELHAENDKLRLLIQRLTRHQFGRRSEQLTDEQLQFGLEDLEQTIAENQAGQDAAVVPPARPRAERATRNHGTLPAHLPRYEVVIDAAPEACPCCGGTMHSIGELRTEQLDIVPAQLRVRVTRRPRYACRSCEEAVVVAEAPARPIDGGMPTEALITHVLISKFCDSLPLYRQSQMLARQGIALDRSTLSNWVGTACWWLAPLYDLVVRRCCRQARCSPTTPRCLCSILAVAAPRQGGSGVTPSTTAYDAALRTRRPPTCIPRTVRAYVRRRTWRASRACCKSMGMLGSSAWRAIARTAPCSWPSVGCTCGVPSTSSTPLPDRRSRPNCWPAWPAYMRSRLRYAVIPPNTGGRCGAHEVGRYVEALHDWLHDQLPRISGASDLAKAMRYAMRHWPGLVAFLDDGRIEMDTNTVERAIRPITLTRKNALFAGSDGGARHWAIAMTLIQTAKLDGVEPMAWLTDVLERVVSGANNKSERVEDVAPVELETVLPVGGSATHRLKHVGDCAIGVSLGR